MNKVIITVLSVLLAIVGVRHYFLEVEAQALRSNGVIVAGTLNNSNILSNVTPTDEESRAIDLLLQYE